MPIPGNEKRTIRKVAKRRQALDFDAEAERLSSLQDFRCLALNFPWDLHPRLAHAVPIGTNAKTIAPRFREQKSRKTLYIHCLVNILFLAAQAWCFRVSLCFYQF